MSGSHICLAGDAKIIVIPDGEGYISRSTTLNIKEGLRQEQSKDIFENKSQLHWELCPPKLCEIDVIKEQQKLQKCN